MYRCKYIYIYSLSISTMMFIYNLWYLDIYVYYMYIYIYIICIHIYSLYIHIYIYNDVFLSPICWFGFNHRLPDDLTWHCRDVGRGLEIAKTLQDEAPVR